MKSHRRNRAIGGIVEGGRKWHDQVAHEEAAEIEEGMLAYSWW